MENLGDRLQSAINQKQSSQSEVARAVGIKPQTVQQLVSGRQVGSKYLVEIAHFLGVNYEWLKSGKGPMQPPVDNLSSQINHKFKLEKNQNLYRNVPVLYPVAAGVWIESDETQAEPIDRAGFLVDKRYSHFDLFGVLVQGNSMNREFDEGDILICVPIESGVAVQNEDRVIIERRRSQDGIVERAVKAIEVDSQGRGTLYSKSTDPRWKGPLPLQNGNDDTVEVKITGIVVGLVRRLR